MKAISFQKGTSYDRERQEGHLWKSPEGKSADVTIKQRRPSEANASMSAVVWGVVR